MRTLGFVSSLIVSSFAMLLIWCRTSLSVSSTTKYRKGKTFLTPKEEALAKPYGWGYY
jgi:hypothetical protein